MRQPILDIFMNAFVCGGKEVVMGLTLLSCSRFAIRLQQIIYVYELIFNHHGKICMCVCMCMCVSVSMCVSLCMCVCVYVCTFVCMYVCMHVCIYMYMTFGISFLLTISKKEFFNFLKNWFFQLFPFSCFSLRFLSCIWKAIMWKPK